LGRLTVIDGEMNAVGLFKQFDADINPVTGNKGRYLGYRGQPCENIR